MHECLSIFLTEPVSTKQDGRGGESPPPRHGPLGDLTACNYQLANWSEAPGKGGSDLHTRAPPPTRHHLQLGQFTPGITTKEILWSPLNEVYRRSLHLPYPKTPTESERRDTLSRPLCSVCPCRHLYHRCTKQPSARPRPIIGIHPGCHSADFRTMSLSPAFMLEDQHNWRSHGHASPKLGDLWRGWVESTPALSHLGSLIKIMLLPGHHRRGRGQQSDRKEVSTLTSAKGIYRN
jgi:hypothetical protein